MAIGRQQATLAGHDSRVTALVVAPDGSWLASGGRDGTVRLWDVATGQVRVSLSGHAGQVTAVAVAPDGNWLASGGSDGAVRIWDVATGQVRASRSGRFGRVMAVAVAPDGSWLATGGEDGTVRIWDTATGQALALMRLENSVKANAWLGVNTLIVGGPGGLYLFDFHAASSAKAVHTPKAESNRHKMD